MTATAATIVPDRAAQQAECDAWGQEMRWEWADRRRDEALSKRIVREFEKRTGLTVLGPPKKPPVREYAPPSPHSHWSVQQISTRWGRSPDYVRDHFSANPDVLRFDRPASKDKHRHFSFTVPLPVLLAEDARMRGGR